MKLALLAAWRVASIAFGGALHLMMVGALLAMPVGLIASRLPGISAGIDLQVVAAGGLIGAVNGFVVFTVIGVFTLCVAKAGMTVQAAKGGAMTYAMVATLAAGVICMVNGAALQSFDNRDAGIFILFRLQALSLAEWFMCGAALGFVLGSGIGAWRGAHLALEAAR